MSTPLPPFPVAEGEGDIKSAYTALRDAMQANLDALFGARVAVRKGTSQNTTLDSLTNITELELPVGANETWLFDFQLAVSCNNTGGFNVALDGPAGAAFLATTIGIGGTAGSGGRGRITAFNTLSQADGATVAYNTYNGAAGDVRIVGSIATGVTSGTLKARFQVAVAGQTATIYAGSMLRAEKTS